MGDTRFHADFFIKMLADKNLCTQAEADDLIERPERGKIDGAFAIIGHPQHSTTILPILQNVLQIMQRQDIVEILRKVCCGT